MVQLVLSGKRRGLLRNQFYYKAAGLKCNNFFMKRPAKAAPLMGNPALTVQQKYGKILPVAADVQCATVAQLVEQLTRTEQVACSNQVSSSKEKPPKVGL